MTQTPLSERKRLVLWGRRNAGKSSLLNALLCQEVSIVSPVAGTTTDTVTRPMELLPFGPIALTDTAGIDDTDELGRLRVKRTLEALEGADLALWVLPQTAQPAAEELAVFQQLQQKSVPVVLVRTFGPKIGQLEPSLIGLAIEWGVDNLSRAGHRELLGKLAHLLSQQTPELTPLEGLVQRGDLLLLVTPVDTAAPKGRLILPQVETIRDALDRGAACIVVQEGDLERYRHLFPYVKLVITDSQAFRNVALAIPSDLPLTSFSLLFARKKGDLASMLPGLQALNPLKKGARVLIWEACRHHRQDEDIASIKIPHLLQTKFQPDLSWRVSRDWPTDEELAHYDLVIGCGACSITRQRMLGQLEKARRAGVPMINFGLFLAYANGLIPRAIQPLGVM